MWSFTGWVDGRIKVAVDRANADARQDVTELMTELRVAVQSLPTDLAKALEDKLEELVPRWLRRGSIEREPEQR